MYLFEMLAEKYSAEEIGTIRYGNILGTGDDFEIEVILAEQTGDVALEAANDDEEGDSFPFLALEIFVDDECSLHASVKLGFWSDDSGGESESVSLNIDPSTTLTSLEEWFEKNRVDFDVPPEFFETAGRALDLFHRCCIDAFSGSTI